MLVMKNTTIVLLGMLLSLLTPSWANERQELAQNFYACQVIVKCDSHHLSVYDQINRDRVQERFSSEERLKKYCSSLAEEQNFIEEKSALDDLASLLDSAEIESCLF